VRKGVNYLYCLTYTETTLRVNATNAILLRRLYIA